VTSPSLDPAKLPATIAELRAAGWTSRTVKEELRANLLDRIAAGRGILPGIIGFGDSVVPAVENAIVAGQDIVFLGERGQAKTRMARLLVELLDERLPVVRGGGLNDDPYAAYQPGRPGCRRRAWRCDPDRLAAARGATPRSWPRPTSRSPT
jgi:Mg-chelatase subunit ChlI